MQRNPHSYQIATGYRTFYSLSLIYQPITKKRLFFYKKAALIELGYALVSSGDINHGNIEIKEFMNYLSAMFNIDLGGYYDAYIAMKERKDRTSYLNKLIENLTKRMDEDDIR